MCHHHWKGLETVSVKPPSRKILHCRETLWSWLSNGLLYCDSLLRQLLNLPGYWDAKAECSALGLPSHRGNLILKF